MANNSRKKKNKKVNNKTAASKKKSVGSHENTKTINETNKRLITSLIFVFLGLFSLFGFFDIDALFINLLKQIIGGLIGWGYYMFPFAMFIMAYMVIKIREAPYLRRIINVLLITIFFGAITNLLFSSTDLKNAGGIGSVLSLLYTDGQQLVYGGVISGFISYILELVFSIYGAFLILLISLIFSVLISLNITLKDIKEWTNNTDKYFQLKKAEREAAVNEYDEEFYEDEDDLSFDNYQSPKIHKLKNVLSAIDIDIDDDTFDNSSDNEDDILSVSTPKTKKTKTGTDNKKKTENIQKTENSIGTESVKPISVEEAQKIAGVPQIKVNDNLSSKDDNKVEKISKADVASELANVTQQIEKADESEETYEFPPIGILNKSPITTNDGKDEVAMNSNRLQTTLNSFGINMSISDVVRGPTVTRYDFELEQGVKLSKVTNLSDDIALALGVKSVRIAAVPDRISTVGVEVPNKHTSAVYLRDIIDTPKFKNAKSKLSFALGKNISDEAIVGNISKLPHLLIAGTTGSGKSVCMNSLIISLLYKASPDELKLIMIDPKMVELGIYNGIPHLYIPVVTDPKKAAGALQWAVVEMLKRYRLFSEQGVRDLDTYNQTIKGTDERVLPRIVIVIDELADLMMAASKEVEESICRVAQMGRAAGMHLIIATQRPSADVITGLMKANIPSRIAFAVSSGLESRIILDTTGAEKLVGNGDMLFSPIGLGKPERIQGAFVSDEEREQVINFIKEGTEAEYSDEIMQSIEKAAEDKNSNEAESKSAARGNDGDYDELLPQAVDVIFDSKQASVSMLQRRLKLGYSRAARIVDQMEELGIVGPFEGSKPRQVLITKEQWQEMQMMHGTAPTEIMETRMEFGDDIPTDEDTYDDD